MDKFSFKIKDPADFLQYCDKNSIDPRPFFTCTFTSTREELPEVDLNALAEEYYEHCYYKKFTQDKVSHEDPALYGLSEEWVEKAKQRYRKQIKKEYEQELQSYFEQRAEWTDMLRGRLGSGRDHSYVDKQIAELNEKITKLKRRIDFLDMPKDKARMMDIARVKVIPIDTIYEVLPNGFFKHNPLRQERSPSNSLYLNRKTNKWTDYATGEFGDLLDLVMKEKQCDLKTAYNYLVHN